ncbi:MAG: hypothetical protein LC641_13510 [Spirochaeta sp.]|nr:hypothetical protein [Spirochaeta sp.]
MDFSVDVIPEDFRSDLMKATELLRAFGAKEIYVFGSMIDPRRDHEPSDLDLAVAGLPPKRSSVHTVSCLVFLIILLIS